MAYGIDTFGHLARILKLNIHAYGTGLRHDAGDAGRSVGWSGFAGFQIEYAIKRNTDIVCCPKVNVCEGKSECERLNSYNLLVT